jgi:hypothetical protein
MNFFDSFWKASFYTSGKATSFWKAFGKFVLVSFFLSVAYAVIFYVSFGKDIPSHITSYGKIILDGYPDELVLTVENGKLSKNIPGSVQLYPLPEKTLQSSSAKEAQPQYVVTIDDSQDLSLALFTASKSLFLFAKDGWIAQANNDTRIKSYDSTIDSKNPVTFSKELLRQTVDVAQKYSGTIAGVCVIAILSLYTIFFSLGHLAISLVIGLIFMLLSPWIIKKKVTYSNAYILTIYALPTVVAIQKLLLLVPFISTVISLIPFLTTFSVLAFLWYMFKGESGHARTHTETSHSA